MADGIDLEGKVVAIFDEEESGVAAAEELVLSTNYLPLGTHY